MPNRCSRHNFPNNLKCIWFLQNYSKTNQVQIAFYTFNNFCEEPFITILPYALMLNYIQRLCQYLVFYWQNTNALNNYTGVIPVTFWFCGFLYKHNSLWMNLIQYLCGVLWNTLQVYICSKYRGLSTKTK